MSLGGLLFECLSLDFGASRGVITIGDFVGFVGLQLFGLVVVGFRDD